MRRVARDREGGREVQIRWGRTGARDDEAEYAQCSASAQCERSDLRWKAHKEGTQCFAQCAMRLLPILTHGSVRQAAVAATGHRGSIERDREADCQGGAGWATGG